MQRVLQVPIGVLAKILKLHVAGRRINHEVRRHRRDVDLVARETNRNQLFVAAPLDLDLYRRPLRSAQLLHAPDRSVQPLASLAHDLGDDVAAANALLVRGRAFEHARRHDVAVGRYDLNADAVIPPFLPLAHLRVLTRREKARMRIERAQHAANCAVDEVLGLDLLDVVRLDRTQRRREGLVVLRNLVVDGKGALAEQPADQSRDDDREDDRRAEGGNVA